MCVRACVPCYSPMTILLCHDVYVHVSVGALYPHKNTTSFDEQ